MRKLNSIFFVVLVATNLFGFYGIFILEQADIRHEMNERISNLSQPEDYETLNFSKEAFSKLLFTDNGREFSYGGRLYDVIDISYTNDGVSIKVDYDAKETALTDAFSEEFSRQQDKDHGNPPVKNILSHFQQDYVTGESHIMHTADRGDNAFGYIYHHILLPNAVYSCLTPPPRFILV